MNADVQKLIKATQLPPGISFKVDGAGKQQAEAFNGLVAAMGLAGFLSGMIMPSRDMLVRAAAPPGAMGRAFGIVTTGFSIGGTVGPMLFGWIMDSGAPRWVFGASVIFMMLTVVMALLDGRRPQRRRRQIASRSGSL